MPAAVTCNAIVRTNVEKKKCSACQSVAGGASNTRGRRKVHEHGMTARRHYAQRVKRLSMAALVASSDNPLVTMVPVLSTSIRAGIELML